MRMEAIIGIDKEKCQKDGLCVAECPVNLLVIDKEGYPRPVDAAQDICIDCGHCVAVCPTAALSQRTISADQCPEIKADRMLRLEQAEQFLRSRRSIRQYKAKSVEREKIEELIRIAGHAPSGHNLQPAKWMVILDSARIHQLAGLTVEWMRGLLVQQPELAGQMHLERVIAGWEKGMDPVLRSAPHLIIAYAAKFDRTAAAAVTNAIAYLELTAPVMGLGSCWAGYFTGASQTFEPLQKEIALPKGCMVYGAVMLGYPKARYYRLPLRKKPEITWCAH
jgi:nitroreductase/NAD-dependent dihydropyrimidine dehydrogenase PreA subunit